MLSFGQNWMLAARLARRELRGGIKGFRIFLACLALGVAAIAGVGSLAAAVVAGLNSDGRVLVGGDVELRLMGPELNADQQAFLAASGIVSESVEGRAMAHRPDGAQSALVEMKAVDGAYPLYGTLALEPPLAPLAALGRVDGEWGVAVESGLLERLGLKAGESLRLGEESFRIRAVIRREPDRVISLFSLGPRVFLARAALAATKLEQPGSILHYQYRLRLPAGQSAAAWIAEFRARWPKADFRIRSLDEAAPGVKRFLDRAGLFLGLVGLTALLVGGIGIGGATSGWLDGRATTIAILKALGAPFGLVFRVYLLQVLAMAAFGIGLGLAIGGMLPLLALDLLAGRLPIEAHFGFYPLPLALAACYGTLTALAFALRPLLRAGAISGAALFRDSAQPMRRRAGILAPVIPLALLGALAVASAPDRHLALWFLGALLAVLALFHGVAWLLARLALGASRHERITARHPGLRLALANLGRPGAPGAGIVLSLGVGLTVLVAVALVEGNLVREIEERVPHNAPSFFFIDIQPDQGATFDALIAAMPGVQEAQRVPSLRGRIKALDGVPVEQAAIAPDAAWAVRGDRVVTYAARLPSHARIVAGQEWPPDYRGPPLVSLDSALAEGFGLDVGKTITVSILGRDVTATIASLRDIDWTTLRMDFAMIFAPGLLEAAPQTSIAAVRVEPQAEAALQRSVTGHLANVTAVPVRDALEAVGRVFDSLSMAVRATAALGVAAGALVLGGAVAAGHRKRIRDAVVLKVLGATRLRLAASYLLEFGLLGLASGGLAAGAGTLAGWAVVTRILHVEWVFLPGRVAGLTLACVVLTLVLGFAGTWRALGVKAATYLRNP